MSVDFSSGLEGGLAEVAIEVLHLLLSHLLESPEDEVGVNADAVETFVRTMRQDFPRDRVPVVLAPLLYREQQDITEDRYREIYMSTVYDSLHVWAVLIILWMLSC